MKKQSPHVRSFQQHLLFQLLGVVHGGHQMIHHAIHADLAKREPERTGCRRVFPKKDRSPVEYLYLCMGIYIYVYLSMYLLIYIFIYVLMYYLSIITYLLIYLCVWYTILNSVYITFQHSIILYMYDILWYIMFDITKCPSKPVPTVPERPILWNTIVLLAIYVLSQVKSPRSSHSRTDD